MDDCAVCYETVSESTGHCTLSCKHSFHISCLTRWSAEYPKCPMCRHPLGVTEAPAKVQPPQRVIWHGPIFDIWSVGNLRRPEPPPSVPPPENRVINIGDGVQVSEGDVALVMQHAGVTRGEAIRALRRYEGDIVNSILMLTSPDPVPPRPPPTPRDPMRTESDDQATAWFLQQMFGDSGGYHWNSYSDMKFRMRNGMRGQDYWTHLDFNEIMRERDGYNSA